MSPDSDDQGTEDRDDGPTIAPEDAPEILHGGAERVPVRWLNGEARAKLSLYQVAAGGQVSLHVHTGKTEHWLIVSGKGEVLIGSDQFQVAEGDVVSTPPGLPHKLTNASPQPLIFVNFVEVEPGARVSTTELDG